MEFVMFLKDPFKMTQFYQVTRNVYMLIRDCWERPIASVAGPYVDVVDRESDDGNWTYKWVSLEANM